MQELALKKSKKPYGNLGVSASSLNGILVTHEHTDHIQSVGNLSKKFNIPVFSTRETFDAMETQTQKITDNNIKKINIDENFSIGEITISPFSIPHDAANPCGFCLSDGKNKISIATDIGHMNNYILNKLEGSKFILLESNYDPEVLKCAKYPFKLKTRIAGPTGHLSNSVAGKTINFLIKSGLETALLGHLSKESNFPELAYQTVVDELIANGTDSSKINLSVASRDYPGKLFSIWFFNI